MELEPSTGTTPAPPDARPRMPEPPPVRLVAVDDVRLQAPSGMERQLDSFYVILLGFEREDVELKRPGPRIAWAPGRARAPIIFSAGVAAGPIYRAENFRLRFQTIEPPVPHPSLRPQGIEVPSLNVAESRLTEAQIEYTRERGLVPGQERLLLQDPAGNWVELTESRPAG
jgi:hypothetical protein